MIPTLERVLIAVDPSVVGTPGRHSTDRGLLGLRESTWSWIVLTVVAALILTLCLGTLAQAQTVPGDGVLTPATPPKEAL